METRVKVVDLGRRYLALRWNDPDNGAMRQKSAKTENRREAERLAAQLEADLQAGRYLAPSKVTWEHFRERFEGEKVASLAEGTGRCYATALNLVETYVRPHRLAELSPAALSRLQARMRDGGMGETTIAKHLRHIKAALNWGHSLGLLGKVPEIHLPKRAKGAKMMKGRPITAEEFARMLAQVETVVGSEGAAAWKRYLTGMWWSGLRLSESLELYWDRDDRLGVELGAGLPMLRISAECEKAHQDRLLPMAPEFAEFLRDTPEEQRVGLVFPLVGLRGKSAELKAEWVSRIGSRIGKAAGVKVGTNAKTGKVKYASIHDLRRSFGERWACRIMPQQLKELMRHESIETTLKYYVGQNAQRTAAALWEAVRQERSQAAAGSTALATDDTFGDTNEALRKNRAG